MLAPLLNSEILHSESERRRGFLARKKLYKNTTERRGYCTAFCTGPFADYIWASDVRYPRRYGHLSSGIVTRHWFLALDAPRRIATRTYLEEHTEDLVGVELAYEFPASQDYLL